eukprot:m.21811 g.21811  ORF g.21811 m.21811 type:complete len:677 (-) comp13548_c0_seq1:10-2040(-)
MDGSNRRTRRQRLQGRLGLPMLPNLGKGGTPTTTLPNKSISQARKPLGEIGLNIDHVVDTNTTKDASKAPTPPIQYQPHTVIPGIPPITTKEQNNSSSPQPTSANKISSKPPRIPNQNKNLSDSEPQPTQMNVVMQPSVPEDESVQAFKSAPIETAAGEDGVDKDAKTQPVLETGVSEQATSNAVPQLVSMKEMDSMLDLTDDELETPRVTPSPRVSNMTPNTNKSQGTSLLREVLKAELNRMIFTPAPIRYRKRTVGAFSAVKTLEPLQEEPTGVYARTQPYNNTSTSSLAHNASTSSLPHLVPLEDLQPSPIPVQITSLTPTSTPLYKRIQYNGVASNSPLVVSSSPVEKESQQQLDDITHSVQGQEPKTTNKTMIRVLQESLKQALTQLQHLQQELDLKQGSEADADSTDVLRRIDAQAQCIDKFERALTLVLAKRGSKSASSTPPPLSSPTTTPPSTTQSSLTEATSAAPVTRHHDEQPEFSSFSPTLPLIFKNLTTVEFTSSPFRQTTPLGKKRLKKFPVAKNRSKPSMTKSSFKNVRVNVNATSVVDTHPSPGTISPKPQPPRSQSNHQHQSVRLKRAKKAASHTKFIDPFQSALMQSTMSRNQLEQELSKYMQLLAHESQQKQQLLDRLIHLRNKDLLTTATRSKKSLSRSIRKMILNHRLGSDRGNIP